MSSTTLEQAFFLFKIFAIFSVVVSEHVTEDVAGVASFCCIKHFLHSVHLNSKLIIISHPKPHPTSDLFSPYD